VLKCTKELHSLKVFPYKIVCYEALIASTTLLDTILKYEKASKLVQIFCLVSFHKKRVQALTKISWWGEAVMNDLYYITMCERKIVCLCFNNV
jgi:hypothetical protein